MKNHKQVRKIVGVLIFNFRLKLCCNLFIYMAYHNASVLRSTAECGPKVIRAGRMVLEWKKTEPQW